jgi:SET domain
VSRAASWQGGRRWRAAAASSSSLLLAVMLSIVVSVALSWNERSALDPSCVPHESGAPDFPESFGATAGRFFGGTFDNEANSGAARELTGAASSSFNDAASFHGVPTRTARLVRNSSSESSSLLHPPPSDDQRVTYRQLWALYGCDSDATYIGDYYDGTRTNQTDFKQQQQQQQRPIPTASTWLYLRQVYNRVVQQHLCRNDDDAVKKNDYLLGSSERLCFVEDVDVNTVDDDDCDHASGSPTTTTSTNGSATPEREDSSPRYKSGFRVPVEIRYSPGKGRGLFALEDVPKGTLVWVSQYEGWMRSGRLYRLLLEALPTNAWRCDVMTFSYYSVSDDEDPNESDETEDWEDEGWEEVEGWEEEDGDESRGQAGSGKAHDRQMIARELESLIAKGNSIAEWERSTDTQTAHSSLDGSDETSDVTATEEGSVGEGADEEWDEWDDGDDYDEDGDVQDPSDRKRPHILVDLDEAALMNADWESSDGRQNINVGLHAEEEDDDDGSDDGAARDEELEENMDGWSQYVALRDIRAGEEILCAYSDFVRDDKGWATVGL